MVQQSIHPTHSLPHASAPATHAARSSGFVRDVADHDTIVHTKARGYAGEPNEFGDRISATRADYRASPPHQRPASTSSNGVSRDTLPPIKSDGRSPYVFGNRSRPYYLPDNPKDIHGAPVQLHDTVTERLRKTDPMEHLNRTDPGAMRSVASTMHPDKHSEAQAQRDLYSDRTRTRARAGTHPLWLDPHKGVTSLWFGCVCRCMHLALSSARFANGFVSFACAATRLRCAASP